MRGVARFVMSEAERAPASAPSPDSRCLLQLLLPTKNSSLKVTRCLQTSISICCPTTTRSSLARLGQIIDLGGDFTALTDSDFERAKKIANKARGKDITAKS